MEGGCGLDSHDIMIVIWQKWQAMIHASILKQGYSETFISSSLEKEGRERGVVLIQLWRISTGDVTGFAMIHASIETRTFIFGERRKEGREGVVLIQPHSGHSSRGSGKGSQLVHMYSVRSAV